MGWPPLPVPTLPWFLPPRCLSVAVLLWHVRAFCKGQQVISVIGLIIVSILASGRSLSLCPGSIVALIIHLGSILIVLPYVSMVVLSFALGHPFLSYDVSLLGLIVSSVSCVPVQEGEEPGQPSWVGLPLPIPPRVCGCRASQVWPLLLWHVQGLRTGQLCFCRHAA